MLKADIQQYTVDAETLGREIADHDEDIQMNREIADHNFTQMNVGTYIYVCTYVRTYDVRMYVRTYVRTYVRICCSSRGLVSSQFCARTIIVLYLG